MSMSVVIRYHVLLCFYAVQYLRNVLFVGLDWIAMGCGMWKSVGSVSVCWCV
jgi:apolipoprotein N-acyltransferase